MSSSTRTILASYILQRATRSCINDTIFSHRDCSIILQIQIWHRYHHLNTSATRTTRASYILQRATPRPLCQQSSSIPALVFILRPAGHCHYEWQDDDDNHYEAEMVLVKLIKLWRQGGQCHCQWWSTYCSGVMKEMIKILFRGNERDDQAIVQG